MDAIWQECFKFFIVRLFSLHTPLWDAVLLKDLFYQLSSWSLTLKRKRYKREVFYVQIILFCLFFLFGWTMDVKAVLIYEEKKTDGTIKEIIIRRRTTLKCHAFHCSCLKKHIYLFPRIKTTCHEFVLACKLLYCTLHFLLQLCDK